MVVGISAFLGISKIVAAKIAGFVISTIWTVVGGMTTAELNRRRGELEGNNPWLKDPKKEKKFMK